MLGTLHQLLGVGFQQSERRMWASVSLFSSAQNSEFITKTGNFVIADKAFLLGLTVAMI